MRVRRAEEAGGGRETDLPGAEEDGRSARGAEGAVHARLQDAARTEREAAGEGLSLRDVDDAVGVIAVVGVGRSDDQREGAAQDVGAGDGERASGVAVAAEAEGRRRASRGRKRGAGEGRVAGIRAEPCLDGGRDGAHLPHEVGLEIAESAQRDRDAAGLAALVVGDQEIEAAAEEVAAGAREGTEGDARARAVAGAQRERRRRVVVDVLEDDELVRADIGGGLDPQATASVDLDVAADDVGARAARAGEPELAFVDLRAAGVALGVREPEDAGAAADEGAVGDVAGDEADRASAGGGGAAVQAEITLLAAELEAVDERDRMRGVTAVQREDPRIEEGATPLERLASAAEIDADRRAVGAETGAGAAGETDLTGARAQGADEITVGLVDGLLADGTREDEVRRGKRGSGRTRADGVAQEALVQDGRTGVGGRGEEGCDAARSLDEGDRVRAVVGDDRGDRVAVPGEVVEMVIPFRARGQEGNVERMRTTAGQQAARGDDEGRVSRARQRARARSLEIQRADRCRARAERYVAGGDLDVLAGGPRADRRVDGVIGRDERGVAEAAARRREVFQEFRVRVGPAADERDVGGEAPVEDLVARAEAELGDGRAFAGELERRGGIRADQPGQADRAQHRRAGRIAHVHHGLAADQGQGAEHFVPVDRILAGRAVVERVALEADTGTEGDDRRHVAEAVLLGGSAEGGQQLERGVAEREPGDGLIGIGAAGGIAGVGADLAEDREKRAGVGRGIALETQTADAVVDERVGAEHAGGAAEADEVGAAGGQRAVEIPDAVEIERARHVGLHARGGDHIDVAVHVGAVGARDEAQRAVAADAVTGKAEVIDQGQRRAARIDRRNRQRRARRDRGAGGTEEAERVVRIAQTGQEHGTAEDGSLTLVGVMSAQHQESGALLGEAADAGDAAADIQDAL